MLNKSLVKASSRGGLEVEQWSDNITLSISVDQSPLGAVRYVRKYLAYFQATFPGGSSWTAGQSLLGLHPKVG